MRGTKISTLPKTTFTSTSVTPGGSTAWVKSSSMLPNTDVATWVAPGVQAPLRSALPKMATTLRFSARVVAGTGAGATTAGSVASASSACSGCSGRSAVRATSAASSAAPKCRTACARVSASRTSKAIRIDSSADTFASSRLSAPPGATIAPSRANATSCW